MGTSALGPRVLLRRLREVMAEPVTAQKRLDKIVQIIAANMVAEVCSVYVLRADLRLELFATEGLKREAVHQTTMRSGEGLVGLIAKTAEPLSLNDAQAHPAFSYRPETGEEIYNSFLGVPILRGGNLVVTEQGIREGVRQVLLPLWNAYSFLALYAPEVGTWRTDSANVLDRYILAKLAELRDTLTEAMDSCDISGACEQLRQFTEALTNWYVRRSRSRFWSEDCAGPRPG